MAHQTRVIEVLQLTDGILSICISCCGLHGEWKPCPDCSGQEVQGCATCNVTALEPHPNGGQFPVVRLGFIKEPDTRSWNAFALVVHDEHGNSRYRTKEELQAYIDRNHLRISEQHAKAQDMIAHAASQKN